MFLLGLAGSALATVAFTFCSDIPGFTVTWSINRFLQSMGWGALVKVTSRWFGSAVTRSLSLSLNLPFLLLCRLCMGLLTPTYV